MSKATKFVSRNQLELDMVLVGSRSGTTWTNAPMGKIVDLTDTSIFTRYEWEYDVSCELHCFPYDVNSDCEFEVKKTPIEIAEDYINISGESVKTALYNELSSAEVGSYEHTMCNYFGRNELPLALLSMTEENYRLFGVSFNAPYAHMDCTSAIILEDKEDFSKIWFHCYDFIIQGWREQCSSFDFL